MFLYYEPARFIIIILSSVLTDAWGGLRRSSLKMHSPLDSFSVNPGNKNYANHGADRSYYGADQLPCANSATAVVF